MRFCLVLLAGLSLTTGAMAQSKPVPSEPAADQPSARQMALSRRYVELAQSEQMEDALRGIIVAHASVVPVDRGLTDADRRFMTDLTTELLIDLMPEMLDRLVPVYARGFSEEELSALVAFYETDLGQSIIDKSYAMMPEMNQAMLTVMPQMMDKMAVRMCARFGCDADELRGGLSGGSSPAGKPSDSK